MTCIFMWAFVLLVVSGNLFKMRLPVGGTKEFGGILPLLCRPDTGIIYPGVFYVFAALLM